MKNILRRHLRPIIFCRTRTVIIFACVFSWTLGGTARIADAQAYTLYGYHVQNPGCADTFDVVNITVTISVDSSTPDGIYQYRVSRISGQNEVFCDFHVQNGLITDACESPINAASFSFVSQLQAGTTGGGLRVFDGDNPSHEVRFPVGEGGSIFAGTDCPAPPGTVYSGSMALDFGGAPELPPDPNQTEECHDNIACSDCQGTEGMAMATYSIHSMLVSLHIEDTPISYKAPRGPSPKFKVVYNQREANQPATFDYSNLGSKWTFNWLSYVTDNPAVPSADARVNIRGGGSEVFTDFDSNTQSYAPDRQTLAVLVRTSPLSYERRFPDGSKEVFSHGDGSSSYPRRIFLTSVVDPQGNVVSLAYDSGLRISSISDAIGQTTTLAYELEADPLKITKVTDPFGRFAAFGYQGNQLTLITDPAGIQSQFSYDAGTDFINAMTTPYGTTSFARGETGNAIRWLEATDPRGGKERVEYNHSAPGISSYESVAPGGVFNAKLNRANTFYWDKKSTEAYPPVNGVYDYSKARVTHWLTSAGGTTVSGIKQSEKYPLESRKWYTYAGQVDPTKVGSTSRPSQTVKLLDDGTGQLWQYQYNSLGNVTQSIDPKGRRMTYEYYANNIDLHYVRQTTGSNNDLLRAIVPNSQHEPLTDTDAAGQTTTYGYNSYGQITSVENAKHEVTTYVYGDGTNPSIPNGYLASISSPAFGTSHAVTSFTYDDAHRVHTVTSNPDNYSVTTAYDNLDRPTQITYPDSTTQTFDYRKYVNGVLVTPEVMTLDLNASKDRDNRWTYRHYNGNRQMDSITDPLGQTTLYDWCTCGSLVGITDPNGNLTTFNRDLEKRVSSKLFQDGSQIHYTYEATTGRLKSILDPNGQTTNYQYYVDNNLKQVSYTNALSPTPTVNYVYDGNYNRITSMMDGIGTTIYTYYPVLAGTLGAGKVHQVNGPLPNSTITYSYDELGRETAQNINGTPSSVTFDALGRIGTNTNALGSFSRLYENDVTQRLRSLNYPNGQAATFHYFGNTNDRRVQSILNSDSSSNTLSEFNYTYDAEGQIQALFSPFASTQLYYDAAKRLTGTLQYVPGLQFVPQYGTEYHYDAAGNRLSNLVTTPLGTNGSSYTVNNLNQLDTVTVNGNGLPFGPVPITYDANGNMTYDGNNQTFEWDAANRLFAINYIDTGNRTEFAYDGLGRRVKITERGPGMTMANVQPVDSSFSEFVSAPFALSSGSYILSFTGLIPDGDNTAFVDAITLNSTPVPDGSFETSPPINGYQYNPTATAWLFQNASGIVHNGSAFGNANAPDGAQAAFVQQTGAVSQTLTLDAGTYTLRFDAAQRPNNHQRLQVTVQSLSYPTTVKTLVWNGNTIAEERNSTGATTTKRFFAEGEQRVGGPDAGNYYYTRDHLGSIREVTDSSGNLIAQMDYDAWGNESVVAGNMNIDFGYTGHYFHQPSGLNLAMYRAYSPTMGRWLSRDQVDSLVQMPAGSPRPYVFRGLQPETFMDGPNLYAYGRNDPITRVDRAGMISAGPDVEWGPWFECPEFARASCEIQCFVKYQRPLSGCHWRLGISSGLDGKTYVWWEVLCDCCSPLKYH